MPQQLSIFDHKTPQTGEAKPVNVASVPQRSPFRYPGGKTWLVPVVRQWLGQSGKAPLLLEPFAGGAIVSLSAAFEGLADRVVMVEMDEDVAAVWEVLIHGDYQKLAQAILHFDLTAENAKLMLQKESKTQEERAFCTILKNRIFHGGIIAKGAGLIKNGENGKGIRSRWYAKTLHDRIVALGHVRSNIQFRRGDAFEALAAAKDDPATYAFIDPPYTLAGRRLYTHFDIDHEALFALTAQLKGKFMLTYDDTPHIRALADAQGLDYRSIPMKTTHHIQKSELIISDNFAWWPA